MLKYCRAFNALVVIIFVTDLFSTPTHGLLGKFFGQPHPTIERPEVLGTCYVVIRDKNGIKSCVSVEKKIIKFSGMQFISTKMLWKRFISEYYTKINKNYDISEDDRIFRKDIYYELIDFILLYFYNDDYTHFRSAQIVAQLTSVRDKACWFYYDQFDFLNKCLQRFFMPDKVSSEGLRLFSDFPEIAKYDPEPFGKEIFFSQYYGLLTKGIIVDESVDRDNSFFIRDKPTYYYFNATDFNFPTALNLDQFKKAPLLNQITD